MKCVVNRILPCGWKVIARRERGSIDWIVTVWHSAGERVSTHVIADNLLVSGDSNNILAIAEVFQELERNTPRKS